MSNEDSRQSVPPDEPADDGGLFRDEASWLLQVHDGRLNVIEDQLNSVQAIVGEQLAKEVESHDQSNATKAGWIVVASLVIFALIATLVIAESLYRIDLANTALGKIGANSDPKLVSTIIATSHSSVADYLVLGPTALFCLGLLALAARLAIRESGLIKIAEAKGPRAATSSFERLARELLDAIKSSIK